MRVEETDDILVQATNDITGLGTSILGDLNQDEYNWIFEDVLKSQPLQEGQRIIDVDSIDERLFVILSDLTLIQISLATKEVISSTKISELPDVVEYTAGEQAKAFGMFKDLNIIGVSTSKCVLLFDYESDLTFMKQIPVANVSYLTFIDLYVVLASPNEETEETQIFCYQIDGDTPEGSISIK